MNPNSSETEQQQQQQIMGLLEAYEHWLDVTILDITILNNCPGLIMILWLFYFLKNPYLWEVLKCLQIKQSGACDWLQNNSVWHDWEGKVGV